jgi:hypothetical protein
VEKLKEAGGGGGPPPRGGGPPPPPRLLENLTPPPALLTTNEGSPSPGEALRFATGCCARAGVGEDATGRIKHVPGGAVVNHGLRGRQTRFAFGPRHYTIDGSV